MPGSAFASSPALGQLTRVETWTLELSNSVLNNTKGRVLKNPDFKLTLTLSYADTDRLSRDFAAWLQAQGVKKGDRIAVMTPNILAFPVAMLQMRTNVPHIFAIGDIVGQPMLAHKAVHEAHVAAEVIAGELQGNKELASAAFNARVIPSVAYTDPEVAWVGLTEDQAKQQGIKVKKGLFPWAASGRAIANGRDEGVTKLLFDDSPEAGSGDGHAGRGHGKILGGGMVGTHAGDMIGEIALAIEMGADAVDIGKTIHPHPTLGESIGMAAEVAHGSCTDVPPARK